MCSKSENGRPTDFCKARFESEFDTTSLRGDCNRLHVVTSAAWGHRMIQPSAMNGVSTVSIDFKSVHLLARGGDLPVRVGSHPSTLRGNGTVSRHGKISFTAIYDNDFRIIQASVFGQEVRVLQGLEWAWMCGASSIATSLPSVA